MAYVTNIKNIVNGTTNKVVILNGEKNDERIEILSGLSWQGDLWVPWIGHQGEDWKAIKIFVEGGYDVVYVYQDYYRPAHKNAIKYSVGKLVYDSAAEIPGNNRGGGNKVLFISIVLSQESGNPIVGLEMA
ncbi:hypothetical protein [Photorhabdus sp. SF281]|uniref:hypothetical protein n=1 Tax=Photorhabdus sp. SF281 TaxID=3459527 RepID=UPI004044AE7B